MSVMAIASSMGVTPRDAGTLSNARAIEDTAVQLLPNWTTPLGIAAVMWLLQYLLLALKYGQ